jgi:hypothetical protein
MNCATATSASTAFVSTREADRGAGAAAAADIRVSLRSRQMDDPQIANRLDAFACSSSFGLRGCSSPGTCSSRSGARCS